MNIELDGREFGMGTRFILQMGFGEKMGATVICETADATIEQIARWIKPMIRTDFRIQVIPDAIFEVPEVQDPGQKGEGDVDSI